MQQSDDGTRVLRSRRYYDLKFPTDTIRRAIALFLSYVGEEKRSKLYCRYTVDLGDDELLFTNEDQFFFHYESKFHYANLSISVSGGPTLSIYCLRNGETEVNLHDLSRSRADDLFTFFEREHKRLLPDDMKTNTADGAGKKTPTESTSQIHRLTIFIGHGRDSQWQRLKGYLDSIQQYDVVTYESAIRAGYTIQQVLEEMLHKADIAFLVHTAEDETLDGASRARENVVHEAGLFQGRLGFTKAIILLEQGCNEYSNIHGLNQIRFPAGNIEAKFGEVIGVILREFSLGVGRVR
jgi:predicted nucleotide-binding protein